METNSSAPTASNSRPVRTGFGDIFSGTWQLYKKNFVLYTTIFAIPTVLVTVLQEFIQPSLVTSILGNMEVEDAAKQFAQYQGPILTAVLAVLAIVTVNAIINFITFGAMLRASAQAEKGQASAGEAYSFSMGKFVGGMGLSVRIFIYTLAWLLPVLFLVFFGGAAALFFGNMTDSEAIKETASQYGSVLGAVGIIGPILLIILIIVVLLRSLNVTFAFPIFFSDENVSSKEALDKSLKLSKGLAGTIFVNYFLMGILFAVIGGIYAALLVQIMMAFMPKQGSFSGSVESIKAAQTQVEWIMAALTLPLLVFAGSMGVIFQYVFTRKAMEEKGYAAADAPRTPGTLGGTPGTLGGTPGTEPGAGAPNRAPTAL